jgi:ParB/RepB/Spo0J family partition protein
MKETNLEKAARETMESVVQEIKTTDKFARLKDHVGKLVSVPLSEIRLQDNVRQSVDTTSVKFSELVDSIRAHGLLQNPVIELRLIDGQHQLFCVAGQRRILAALQAGLKAGACLIQEYHDPADRVASGLVENLMREDLHCLDVAEGYYKLARHGWSEAQIAERFEREKRTIHRYLKIAAWPPHLRARMREFPAVFTSKVLFNEFISRSFQDEAEFSTAIEAKIAGQHSARARSAPTPALQQAQAELQAKFLTRVAVKGNEEKGQISLSYDNSAEFQRLLRLLTD